MLLQPRDPVTVTELYFAGHTWTCGRVTHSLYPKQNVRDNPQAPVLLRQGVMTFLPAGAVFQVKEPWEGSADCRAPGTARKGLLRPSQRL